MTLDREDLAVAPEDEAARIAAVRDRLRRHRASLEGPVVVAAALLVVVLVTPLWRIDLLAPQYPEGLGMLIRVNTITGIQPNDLNNINGLNHYIGMRHIEVSMFPEFQYMIYIVGFVIAIGLLTSLINRRYMLVVYSLLIVACGIAALVDGDFVAAGGHVLFVALHDPATSHGILGELVDEGEVDPEVLLAQLTGHDRRDQRVEGVVRLVAREVADRALDGRRHGAINLGTGEGTTVRELVTAFEEVTGRPLPVEVAPRRPGDSVGAYTRSDRSLDDDSAADRHHWTDGQAARRQRFALAPPRPRRVQHQRR